MIRWRLSLLGRFAAMLALVAQIVAGALVPQPLWAASKDATPCAETSKAPGHNRPHERPGKPNCPLCPLCLAIAHPAPTLAAPPPLPSPSIVRVARAVPLPPVRAPPALPFPAARPRGPPFPA
jgi:hypothetical protein